MDIQKLKKRLMREELRRRRSKSKTFRLLVSGGLLLLILFFAGLIFYVANLDKRLEEDFQRAEVLVENGQYEEAVDLYRGIFEKHHRFHLAPQAIYQAGDVLNLYLKQYHEALLAYMLLEKDFPNSTWTGKARLQVAEIYKYRLRDYNRAVLAYQKLLDSGAADGDRLQYEVADAYFRLENFEQARIEFETLRKNFPDSPLLAEVLYRIATAWSLEGELEEAEKGFREVMRQHPASPYAIEANFGLASLLEEREELLEALKILKGLAGNYPNSEALAKKTDQVQERIRKKQRAI